MRFAKALGFMFISGGVASSVWLSGCASADGSSTAQPEPEGVATADITARDCPNDPFACTDPQPPLDALHCQGYTTGGVWHPWFGDGDGGVQPPQRNICLGLHEDITKWNSTCHSRYKCNYLNMDGWSACANKWFVTCAYYKLIQPRNQHTIIVSPPSTYDGGRWVTTQEMCLLKDLGWDPFTHQPIVTTTRTLGAPTDPFHALTTGLRPTQSPEAIALMATANDAAAEPADASVDDPTAVDVPTYADPNVCPVDDTTIN